MRLSLAMGQATIHTEAIRRAATAIGGEAALARVLLVPDEQARRWVMGTEYPSTEIYLKALDLLIATGGY